MLRFAYGTGWLDFRQVFIFAMLLMKIIIICFLTYHISLSYLLNQNLYKYVNEHNPNPVESNYNK